MRPSTRWVFVCSDPAELMADNTIRRVETSSAAGLMIGKRVAAPTKAVKHQKGRSSSGYHHTLLDSQRTAGPQVARVVGIEQRPVFFWGEE
jgi:hypothetical protein